MATNSERLQQVISDDLFPQMQHISDVKQVLDLAKDLAQNFREPQMKAIIFLKELGSNDYLHPNGSPYEKIIEFIEKGKVTVADPNYYLDTIEALIPKPPKPLVIAEKGEKK